MRRRGKDEMCAAGERKVRCSVPMLSLFKRPAFVRIGRVCDRQQCESSRPRGATNTSECRRSFSAGQTENMAVKEMKKERAQGEIDSRTEEG